MNIDYIISNCDRCIDANFYIRNVQDYAINSWYYKQNPFIGDRTNAAITIGNMIELILIRELGLLIAAIR